jgi:rubredoxin
VRRSSTRYCCPGCGYTYDEARGDSHEGFAPGTPWAQIPVDWACPDCTVNEKADFRIVRPDERASPP